MKTTAIDKNSEEYSRSIFWRGFSIWFLATIFYAFDNLLNVSPSAMKPELAQAFAISAADFGSLSACYPWAYGLMQIPAGILMDKIGPRRLLSAASILCAIGSFLFGTAETLFAAKVARLFIGVGASFAVVGCSKIASVWFSPRKFAFFMGLMVAVGFCGAAFGLATVSRIIDALGWRNAMQYGGYFAFALSILIFMIIRDRPKKLIIEDKSEPKQEPLLQGIKEVVANPQAWIASIYAGLMFVPTLAFAGLWGTPFLTEAHGFSRESAGELVSLVFIGWAVGGPIFGWVSDKLGKRNPPLFVANIVTIIICLAIIYTTNAPSWVIGVLMFLLGAFSSGFIIAFAVMRESNRSGIAGTAIGFINMLNTFGGAALQTLIGKILDVTASDTVVTQTGDKVFSLADYQGALIALPVCLIVSLVTLFFLKETNCRPKDSSN